MVISTIVVGGLLALAFAGAGASKLVGLPLIRGSARRFGMPRAAYRASGALEIAGAAGIVVGLWRVAAGESNLDVVAASCLFLLVVAAVATHVRAGEPFARWDAVGHHRDNFVRVHRSADRRFATTRIANRPVKRRSP